MIPHLINKSKLTSIEKALELRKSELEALAVDVADLEREVDGLRVSMGLEPRNPVNPTAEG